MGVRKRGNRCLSLIFILFFFCVPLSAEEVFPFQAGEVVEFDIVKFLVKVGSASLTYHGLTELENQPALLVTFTATAPKFLDTENIYLDPETFQPLQVVRDLDIFGKVEKITEIYARDQGIVKILKIAKDEETTQVIKHPRRLDNIYGFLYKFRAGQQFKKGKTYHLNLPTKEVKIMIADSDTIKVAEQKFNAYYLESVPKQYKMWFDQSPRKIPLRIEGALGALKASLVMVNYK